MAVTGTQSTKQKRAVVDKWKKKKKYSIIAPKSVGNIELGETIADKPELLVDRIIKVNMGMALNLLKKKHIDLSFKVKQVQGSNANTELVGYDIKNSYLKRLIRRRSSKIETVNYLASKDGKSIKIKAVIVSARKAEAEKCRDVRKMLENFIKKIIISNTAEGFMSMLLQKEILDDLMSDIKKIVPVKRAEIETVKVLN